MRCFWLLLLCLAGCAVAEVQAQTNKPVATPEPATWIMLALLGASALIGYLLRRRK
jgi:hypothetical protein